MLNFLRTVKFTSWCVEGKAVSMVLGSSLRTLNADNIQWDSCQGEHKLHQSPGRLMEDENSFEGKYRHNYKIQIL